MIPEVRTLPVPTDFSRDDMLFYSMFLMLPRPCCTSDGRGGGVEGTNGGRAGGCRREGVVDVRGRSSREEEDVREFR